MGRTIGTPNKITAKVRSNLENLIDGLVDSIHIEDLNTSQRIKLLQIALQYTLPRLQAMVVKEENSIFDEPIEINVLEKDYETGKVNVTSKHIIDPIRT